MMYLSTGFFTLLLSIGVATNVLINQHEKFRNLHFKNKNLDCDISEVIPLTTSESADVKDPQSSCLLPDMAAHGESASFVAREYLTFAIDYCRQSQCNEY